MSEEQEVVEEVAEEEVVETPAEAVETTNTETTEKAFVDSMLEQIEDEELKGHKMWDELKGKSAAELAQYTKELKSFAGKKGDIPKADATEEEWNAFYEKMGRPDSVDGYDFSMNDDFKELVGDASSFYEDALGWFKETAFKNGLPASKAEEMVDGYFSMVAEQSTEMNKIVSEREEANEAALKTEWGNEYDGINNGIKAMLKNNGMSDDDIARADSLGVLKEPALAIALGKISAQFADDPQIGHHQTKTVSGLRDQLNDINFQVGEYVKKGESIPKHIQEKRMDIMNKLGDNL